MRRAGDLTYEICSQLLDEIITVDSDEICAAVQDVYEDTRAIAQVAKKQSAASLKKLMGISDKLAELNVERFKAFLAAGNFDSCREMIEEGAFDLGTPDSAGQTPLMIAAAHGSLGVVEALLAGGVEVDAQGQIQLKPTCIANLNGDDFLHDPSRPLPENASLLLLSADAGG